jgi:hypothetical protein
LTAKNGSRSDEINIRLPAVGRVLLDQGTDLSRRRKTIRWFFAEAPMARLQRGSIGNIAAIGILLLVTVVVVVMPLALFMIHRPCDIFEAESGSTVQRLWASEVTAMAGHSPIRRQRRWLSTGPGKLTSPVGMC